VITVSGPGRCIECSYHVALQGHWDGCSRTAPITPGVADFGVTDDLCFMKHADELREAERLWRARAPRCSRPTAHSSAYDEAAVRRELTILRNTTSGRNPQCNDSALSLARLSDGKGGFALDRSWLRDRLIDAMHANGSVRENGLRGVNATIDSAFAKADLDGPRVS
jgi:hypothetical protein